MIMLRFSLIVVFSCLTYPSLAFGMGIDKPDGMVPTYNYIVDSTDHQTLTIFLFL